MGELMRHTQAAWDKCHTGWNLIIHMQYDFNRITIHSKLHPSFHRQYLNFALHLDLQQYEPAEFAGEVTRWVLLFDHGHTEW